MEANSQEFLYQIYKDRFMREGRLLFSAVQFLMIAALFSGGAAFFALHYLPQSREQLADWIINSGMNFFSLGSLLTGVAFVLTICFWAMQRFSYVRVEMHDFSIAEPMVRETIAKFWKEEFPDKRSPSEIYLSAQNIEVIVEDQEQDLEQVEKTLSRFLSKQLGYRKPFFVTLTKR